MDIPPFQTQVNQPPGQPPTSWNQIAGTGANCFPPIPASKRMDKGVPGADSVLPQVIATTALPALARQAKEVEQRNPRKRSAACQSTKTTAKRAASDQDNEEQIATTLRECNTLMSNIIQTAHDDDSTRDVSHGSNQTAQRRQSTMTWASNIAETQLDQPQSILAKTRSSEI
jgi:hypothetical protein